MASPEMATCEDRTAIAGARSGRAEITGDKMPILLEGIIKTVNK